MSKIASATAAWRALRAHGRSAGAAHLRALFARDPARFTAFSSRLGPLLVDYSKQRITRQTLKLLVNLARARGVEAARDAMLSGALVNTTERRAVLHTALRAGPEASVKVDGRDVMPEVRAALFKMKAFAEAVRGGAWRGATGRPIRHIVNIGIGGSHLGPMFVADALRDFQRDDLSVAYVSNPDRAQIDDVLKSCDPAATLFTVASKTFTTVETMANAHVAREWIVSKLGPAAVARHFAAVSTNLKAVEAFGIESDNVFPMWDWVGGRYSVWSAVGLSVALACGFDAFERLLSGARLVDRHFATAPLASNLPVLLAMIGIWNADVLAMPALAVLPYDHRLRLLPSHLQQVDMESNGKAVTRDGKPVASLAGPILFGGGGSDSQHSFFQLLHQSRRVIPCDLVVSLTGGELLVANAFAQAEALMHGRSAAELTSMAKDLRAHRAFTGNRPTTTLLLDDISPESVGALIALYEHKVFVQGAIWGVNSFDQWGVELGKELATRLGPMVAGASSAKGLDSSTAGLIAAYRAKRRGV